MLKIDDEEKLKAARKGILEPFLDMGQRPAVTIGLFQSEDSNEFKNFNKVATILYGRYHFVYSVKRDSPSSLTTFRPFERMRRLDYNGKFDVPTLIKHVTQGSNPSVMNMGQSFTSDIIYYSPKDLLLLIHNEDKDRKTELFDLASKKENSIHFNFAHIDRQVIFDLFVRRKSPSSFFRAATVALDKFFNAIELQVDAVPILCFFASKQARCLKNVQKITQNMLENGFESVVDAHVVELSHKKPHPLKYIQLEHINLIFGEQAVELLPEPLLAKVPQNHAYHHHGGNAFTGDMPSMAASGCPMMAHLNPSVKDEL